MELCSCAKPEPLKHREPPHALYCGRCQRWLPAKPMTTITDNDWKRELTAARGRPNALSGKILAAMKKLGGPGT